MFSSYRKHLYLVPFLRALTSAGNVWIYSMALADILLTREQKLHFLHPPKKEKKKNLSLSPQIQVMFAVCQLDAF